MAKIVSPEVFELLQLAVNSAEYSRRLLESITVRKEGMTPHVGDTLSPQIAEAAEECLTALTKAQAKVINVDALFLQQTRWICPA